MDAVSDDQFSWYGTWNTLTARGTDGRVLATFPAHDGDFFPESPMDYVEALRAGLATDPTLDRPLVPMRVDIDVTQVCNARCTFCFSRPYQVEGYRGQWTTAKHLDHVIAELGQLGSKTIRFCGGGDPMLHPDIERILPLAHRAALHLCVITNLDFIDDALSDLILEHVDHLRWSVNAASDATRIAIHRPGGGANRLSQSIAQVERLVAKRERAGRNRRPMICSTFLIVPENVGEIVLAARALRAVGVDSVSFRPVYHGLTTPWSERLLARASERLAEVAELEDRPRFMVFTPKRDVLAAAELDPNDHFELCLSRRLRTVLEASSAGLALQSCGTYRGSGPHPPLVVGASDRFETVWRRTAVAVVPPRAPAGCVRCIDVSMNVTLAAIARVLRKDRHARFKAA